MKSIISYLMCIALAAFITFEISGEGGLIILILLLSALAISLGVMVYTYKTINISLELSTDILNKGDDLTAVITADKRFYLPSCFIAVTLECDNGIVNNDTCNCYRFISTGLRGEEIEISLNARYCGSSGVRISSIVLGDYLGLIRKKLKALPEERQVRVIPRIPETGSQSEVVKSVGDNVSFDDSDEESDESSNILTGVPGYEHRAYIPGDPLKRVNWKLSSKREELMVRLDEKVTSSSQVFVLDVPQRGDSQLGCAAADKIVEASLALLNMLVRSGYESEFNFWLEGWQMVSVSDEKSLRYLQERLAGIRPYPDEERFPDKNINEKGKAMMCLTACTAEDPKRLEALKESFRGSLLVCEMSGIREEKADMWVVNDDFEFSKMQ